MMKINERQDFNMKRWEYKCVSIMGLGERTTRILNEYGKNGWELVCVTGVWHYFKREIKRELRTK